MTSDSECRGSWVLGTACGTCPRCVATRPEQPDEVKQITTWLRRIGKPQLAIAIEHGDHKR